MARIGTAPRRALKTTCKRTLVYPICRSSTTGRFRNKTRGVKCVSELRTLCRSKSAGTFTSRPSRESNRAEGEHEDRLVVYDDQALKYMQGWYSGQGDPLYAIISSGGIAPRSYFERALSNVRSDLRGVKKLPPRKGDGGRRYQLGKGTFTKAEIGELEDIEMALSDALQDRDAIYNPNGVRGRVRRPLRRR